MEVEEILSGQKRKKRSHIEELEKLLEEDEGDKNTSKMDDDLKKKIETLINIIMEVANSTEDEELLMEIKEDLEEVLSRLEELKGAYDTEKIEQILEKEAAAILKVVKEVRTLREEINKFREVSGVVEEIKRFIEEERRAREREISELEKELEAIKETVNHVVDAVDEDIEKRMAVIKKLSEKLQTLEERLGERDNEELVEELTKLREDLLGALEKIKLQGEKEIETISHLVEEMKENVSRLEQRLSELEAKEVLNIEEVKRLAAEVRTVAKKSKRLLKIVGSNSQALSKYGADVADLLVLIHDIQAKVEHMLEERSEGVPNELFHHLDQKLFEISALLRDVQLKGMEKIEKEIDELRHDLENLHAEVGSLFVTMKTADPTAELKEIEKILEDLTDKADKGILSNEEVKEKLSLIEKRLEDIVSLIPVNEIKMMLELAKQIETKIDQLHEKTDKAAAVITKDDIKDILRDIEELRAAARFLKEVGLREELEQMKKVVEELEEKLSPIPERTIHIRGRVDELEEVIRELREHAEELEHILNEKLKLIASISTHVEKLGRKTGVVEAHLLKKKVGEAKKLVKSVTEVTKVVKRTEKKLKTTKEKIEKKRPQVVIKRYDNVELAARALFNAIVDKPHGYELDIDRYAEKKGGKKEVFRKAAQLLVRRHPDALKLEKPLLPFFGTWKLKKI